MRQPDALSISIGVLGGVATLMTATVLTVPVWVIFIACASFFILGGATDGLVRSIASNLTGIVIASLPLLVIHTLGGGTAAAVAVGVGSAAMVGTVAVTGHGITTASLHNPALVAALSMVLGAVFGIASEYWGATMTTRPAAEPTPEGQS